MGAGVPAWPARTISARCRGLDRSGERHGFHDPGSGRGGGQPGWRRRHVRHAPDHAGRAAGEARCSVDLRDLGRWRGCPVGYAPDHAGRLDRCWRRRLLRYPDHRGGARCGVDLRDLVSAWRLALAPCPACPRPRPAPARPGSARPAGGPNRAAVLRPQLHQPAWLAARRPAQPPCPACPRPLPAPGSARVGASGGGGGKDLYCAPSDARSCASSRCQRRRRTGRGQARRIRRHGQDHDLRPGRVRGRLGDQPVALAPRWFQRRGIRIRPTGRSRIGRPCDPARPLTMSRMNESRLSSSFWNLVSGMMAGAARAATGGVIACAASGALGSVRATPRPTPGLQAAARCSAPRGSARLPRCSERWPGRRSAYRRSRVFARRYSSVAAGPGRYAGSDNRGRTSRPRSAPAARQHPGNLPRLS